MKQTLLISSVLLSLFFTTSCSKDSSDPRPSYPIVGLWIGSYDIISGGPEADSLYYSFDLRIDSSIIVQSLGADGNTYYGRGKWSLSGSNFSATITTSNSSQTGVVQTATATYNSGDGTLTSGEVITVGGPFKGTFNLNRIN